MGKEKRARGCILSLSVILTVLRQTIVNGALFVEHVAIPEPLPLALCPVEVFLVVGGTVCQMCSNGQEELVGDGVDIAIVMVRVDSTITAGRLFGSGLFSLVSYVSSTSVLSHWSEAYMNLPDTNRNFQIFLLLGKIVCSDPCECPPRIIVVRAIYPKISIRCVC